LAIVGVVWLSAWGGQMPWIALGLGVSWSIYGLLRKLQRYTVQVPEKSLRELLNAGLVEVINDKHCGNQFYALIPGTTLYDAAAGLNWTNNVFIEVENHVI